MNNFHLHVFQSELETQCKFVRLGAMQLDAALNRRSGDTRVDVDAVWFAVQSILMAAANASKLLWGVKSKLSEERQPLRESVDVDDSSPLNSRDVRNDFEHFDERLDSRFKKESTIYIGRNIGPSDMFQNADGTTPDHLFGHFDSSTGIVTFWDRSIELRPLIAETERVLSVLEASSPRV